MEYKIENQIIPGLNQDNLAASNLIIAHESGNPKNTGSNSLDAEINYMMNNWGNAFTSHFVGGGGRIVQLAHVGKLQYGAGPKANPYSYAHVELARTNNAETFKKDYAAYIWLLRKLATDAGIPKTFDVGSTVNNKGIKSHNWVSQNLGGTTHTDPFSYLASFGLSKAQFKKDVEAGSAAVKPTKPSQPAPIPRPENLGLVDYMVSKGMDASKSAREKLAVQYGIKGYDFSAGKNIALLNAIKKGKPVVSKPAASSGGSVVDYMNANGMDSSYSNRAKLAKQYGISDYKGTAGQNTTLLSKMKAGKPESEPAPSKKGDQKTTSIVTYLDSIGADSGYSNRAKLAANNGIKGYKGTAAQNTSLLKKVRGGASASISASNSKGDQKTSSVVDYLKSIKTNSSFANRKKLAAKYGIKNYTGTAAQNSQLLKKIRK